MASFSIVLRRERDYATRALLPTVVGSNPRVLIQKFSLNKKSNHVVAFFILRRERDSNPR